MAKKEEDAASQMVDLEASTTVVDAKTEVQPIDVGKYTKPKLGREKKAATREPNDHTKEFVYMLDEALRHENRLMTKSKDNEVNAIYKALKLGLMHAFPYRHQRMLGLIYS